MSFLAPGWLLLGLLGVLVLWLHIRRRTVVEVSSVELWRRLAATTRPPATWQPPKLSWLLLLQLLAVALLVLALARPLLGAVTLPDHRIIIVDTSGSMSALAGDVTRFERALAWLRRDLERLEPGSEGLKVSLLAAGAGVEVVGARLGTLEAAQALARLEPSDGGARWAEVAARLPGLTAGGESVRITVLTDGAGAEAARTAVAAQLPETNLEVLTFGAGADNAALAEVRVTPLDSGAGRWQVAGTAQRFARDPQPTTQPITLSVLFTLEGTEGPGSEGALPWAEHELNFEEGRAAFDFEVELPGPGLLELRLPDDTLASDNRAQVVLRAAPRTVRVLHVGPDNPPLRRALGAVGGVEVSRAAALPAESAAFDLVVVDRVTVPRHPGTHTLWLGGASLPGEAPPPLADATPSGWESGSPLADAVDLSTVVPGTAFRVLRLPGAVVLLEASNTPLIQARTTGAGREVVVAFDLPTSPWTEELGFPVFIANVVRWIAPWQGQLLGPRCTVGEVCPLEPRALYGGLTLRLVAGEEGAVTLPSPFVSPGPEAAAEQAWAPPGFADFFYPERAGAYRLGNGGELLIVDAPAGSEADVRASGTADTGPATEAARAGWPLFRWLLLAGLLILLLETLLAGRGVDRFLRPSSLGRGKPLATRYRLILGLRALTLVLASLALFGVPWLRPSREQRLVLIADDPRLYDEEAQQQLADVRSRRAGGLRRAGVVVLENGGTVVADPGKPPLRPPDGRGLPEADLESALELSLGLLGETDGGRIAVVAGGAQTRGEVARVLPELAARGTPVDVVPLGGVPDGEVLLESLTLPPQLRQGDSFTLEGVIYSRAAKPATVRLWREGQLRGKQRVQLSVGRNRIKTELGEEEAGRYLYEYEVVADGDVFPQNNRAGVVAAVLPQARVALITPQPQWGQVLADALAVQGIEGVVMAPAEAPFALEGLLGYDAVVLANVPAIDLHSEQQALLETWVRGHGGGLLVLGGENSFGPGGYYRTPLERVSPLSSRIPREAPQVAMLFVLDRSGSMQQQVDGITRLDIAKQATVDATGLLHPQSLVGVVVFDSAATTLLPLRPLGTNAGVAEALGPLQPGGGTSIYPGLEAAYRQLRAVDATTRHIVVMTDGLSEPGAFDALLDRITADDITVSAVSIGQGADTRLLQDIARRGGGAFHATTDFRALPSILSQEALLLSSTPVEEVSFRPRWGNREAAFLQGLPDALPPLSGYVQTSRKPAATLHLLGPEDDPILASWRYGLGRVVAFASHGAGAWTRAWLGTPSYPLLWSQAVRWALPPVAKPGLHLELARRGDEVEVEVQAVSEAGEVAAGLRLEASFSLAGTESRSPLALSETAPGRYRGRFVAGQPGRYLARVVAQAETEAETPPFTPVTGEVYHGYPARYAFGTHDTERLQGLAAATGGRVLFGDEPLLTGAAPLRWRWLPAWPLWTVLALALLAAELTLRYAPGLLSWQRPSPRSARGGAPSSSGAGDANRPYSR